MKVGLDIDNVIADFDSGMLEELLKEDKRKGGKGIVNPDGPAITHFFDWSKEEVSKFFDNNVERVAKNLKVIDGAKEYIDRMISEGHKIYLITHRVYPHYKNGYEVTEKWLRENGISYDKLIISKSTNKTKECLENNVDIMFDDSRTNCHMLTEGRVNCFLVGTKYNKKYRDGLKVVNNWEELYGEVKKLEKKKIILDTDMYNEVDDQFALSYLMKSIDMFDLEAITIAPFMKSGYADIDNISDGTDKSYEVTLKLLDMLNKSEYKEKVYKGAIKYFNECNESNEAVDEIIEIASKNDKTTIIAIGAITNVALAIKMAPEIINKIKVVWLGGNSFLSKDNDEFNFRQDIDGVRKVFDSGVELVVIPCRNVASHLSTTIYELEHYLSENNELNKYLLEIFRNCKKAFIKTENDKIGQSKTLWDLSAIAYMINSDWFECEMISCPNVLENGLYERTVDRHNVIFVNDLYRNKIYKDFFMKMSDSNEN